MIQTETPHLNALQMAVKQYSKQVWLKILILFLLAVFMLFSFCADISIGPSNLPLKDVIRALFDKDNVDLSTQVIIWEVRLPYSIIALLVGAALSLAGCEMQTVLHNPMASPFTLGISAAASFGAALTIILGISFTGFFAEWTIALNAFMFALGAVLLLQALARLQGSNAHSLVLFGIALVFTFNALIGIVQYIASAEVLQQFVFWSLGSLSRANWQNIAVLGIVLLLIFPFSFLSSWQLTALRLGEDSAKSYGVPVKRLRFFSFLRISILTATAIAFVGNIGFIGLVGPHIAKLLVGEDHRFSLPASVLSGALVLSLASIASKIIVPGALLPVGIVTSLIGVPVFIILIYAKNRK